jgi:hypothetical protein
MTVCCLGNMLRPATVRLGFLAAVFSVLVAAQTSDPNLGGLGNLVVVQDGTTLAPTGCSTEIEACRATYVTESAGKEGNLQCEAFKRYQACYYPQVSKCNFVEKKLQDTKFIATRTMLFKTYPKCAVSTTPWDSSLLSDSQMSQSLFGYQGSSPNSILSDSGSGSSGEETSGPISGTLGLYMNVGQWIVFLSCCCCACTACIVMALCHPRSKRNFEYYDDDFDEDFYPPQGMYPPTGGFPVFPGTMGPSMGSFGGGMPQFFPNAGMASRTAPYGL